MNILDYKDKLAFSRTKRNELLIFSILRKKWLKYTEEELCRQCFVYHLVHFHHLNTQLMAEEKMVVVDGRMLRFDLLIYSSNGQPYMLIELKAPKVPISTDTFLQSSQYLKKLNAFYLCITNGISEVYFKYNQSTQRLTELNQAPFG